MRDETNDSEGVTWLHGLNGNRVSYGPNGFVRYLDDAQAALRSLSLNCKNCVNCLNCVQCSDCTNCYDCIGLSGANGRVRSFIGS